MAALHKSWFGYWLGRIHTNRDTVFQAENVELLRRGALALAASISLNGTVNQPKQKANLL